MNAIRISRRAAFSVTLATVLYAGPLWAQNTQLPGTATKSANGKQALTLADYARWNRISASALSPNGLWFAYAVTPNEGDGKLHIVELDGSKTYTATRATGPTFSDDSRWVAYFVGPSEGGGRGGRGGGSGASAPNRYLHVLDVTTGAKDSIADIASFRFNRGSSHLALKKNKPQSQTSHEGTDLIVRNLQDGSALNLGNVDEFAFNESGTHLAYVIDAANRLGNGLFLQDLTRGTVTMLSSQPLEFNQLVWDRAGTSLAVLKGVKPQGMVHRANALQIVTGIGTPKQSSIELDGKDPAIPGGFVVSDFGAVTFSRDGARVYFGLKEQEAEAPTGGEPKANVDVWHWQDEDVQSVQQVRAEQNRRFTYTSTYHIPTRKFLRLADEEMRQVTPTANGRWGIGRLDKPYRLEIAWGGARADLQRIDLNTGERTPIARGLSRAMGASPDGKWYLYLQDKQVIAYNIESQQTTNLTQQSGVDFIDKRDDHPYELPIYGVAGWSKDGKAILLYHDFDIWSLSLAGGKATNLTGGVGDAGQIRFRIVRLDGEGASGGGGRGGGPGGGSNADEGLDLTRPLTLSAYGERTKKSGYYELKPGGKPQPLIYEDATIGSVDKADKADRMVFTRQTFVDFPDFYMSNGRFAAARKITNANPQQSEFAWSPGRVLIDYTDARGNKLQGTLALPANYEPGKRYPMLVYFYEIMSNQHHRYSMPTYDDRPHMSTYTSNGYLVLQPDVVYTIGQPGTSAVDDVTSAVKKVIELGYADPQRIGLQGHSWGGYQSSYILTQTDMFAAVVTGAPVTNLVSFYNELYKSSGTVQQGIMEVGQVRMGRNVTPWSAHELYESQSPLHQAEKIKTPFLILHGTADGAVDWHQGLEYFNAARRLGKKVILLSYPDEPHHLANRANQKDFQIRMKQFFDHYLKNTPAPKWMTEGVPFLQKGKEPVLW
jgi:dipeptidyl aminopeptidase/acylaminoacyl peptidase